ncbi:MAG: serine/threonine-protein kinase [Elainellaceae cyanobacterium]
MAHCCYCLNPACPAPQNPSDAAQCRSCGAPLTLANRYRALSLLGKHTSGQTWLGQDISSGDLRVIQRSQMAEAADDSGAFRQYGQRLRQLSRHPQIPQLLDLQVQSSGYYLLWEFIDGVSLAHRLAQATPSTEAQVRQLLQDLLPVFQAVHRHGVIHRDVKPQNIICVARQRPWLVDFGAAVLVGPSAMSDTAPSGNAEYGAPEQILAQPTFASDLYSLGLICVQLLTLITPFDLYARLDSQRWQACLPTPIAPGLEQILTTLLRPARQRYRTAGAVLADLQALPAIAVTPIEDQPEDAMAQSFAQPLEKSPKQHPDSFKPWRCRHVLTGHRGAVTAIAVSDGYVISGGSDRTIQIWTWQGQRLQTLQNSWFGNGHRDRITALQIDAGEVTLLSSSDDGTLCQWSLVDYSRQSLWVSPEWGLSAFAAIPGLLVSGGANGTLQLWDTQNGVVIESWRQHQVQISGLAISPNHNTLLSSSFDGTVRFWNLKTAALVNTLQIGLPITTTAVLPHWDVLAIGDSRGQIQLWDIVAMTKLRTISAHSGSVTALSTSRHFLASGGEDAQIYLWGMPDQADKPLEGELLRRPGAIERLTTLGHDWSITAIAFSPDGTWIASGSADETLQLWQRQL